MTVKYLCNTPEAGSLMRGCGCMRANISSFSPSGAAMCPGLLVNKRQKNRVEINPVHPHTHRHAVWFC